MPRPMRQDRQECLQRAMALFWDRGYHATSMKDLEQVLDMRPGSIYAAFGSKEGLYSEALTLYARDMASEFSQRVSSQSSVLNALASYVTVNISSPNTKNLRALQGASELDALLGPLKAAQQRLADQHGKQVPLALKIAPDLSGDDLSDIAEVALASGIDGLIERGVAMVMVAWLLAVSKLLIDRSKGKATRLPVVG
mgnify:CR=1 FL=1